MQILIQIKAVVVLIFTLLFLLVPACIIALPFNLDRRLKIVSPVWRLIADWLVRYGCGANIIISEDHRSPEFAGTPPYGLFVANHQSFIDIPLIITKYQVPPIMKKEVMYIPIFGWMGWISGALPVSRNSNNSRRQVFEKTKKRILKDRIGIQVYPEGTRSKTGRPRPFEEMKRTLLVFAYNEKIPVIPTSIYGTRGILSNRGLIKSNRNLGIIVHKEIDPKNFADAESFSRACWEKVVAGHDSMLEKLGPLNENLSLV